MKIFSLCKFFNLNKFKFQAKIYETIEIYKIEIGKTSYILNGCLIGRLNSQPSHYAQFAGR